MAKLFEKLFCTHDYELIAQDETVYLYHYLRYRAPVKFYMCKKCGKVKRVAVK